MLLPENLSIIPLQAAIGVISASKYRDSHL